MIGLANGQNEATDAQQQQQLQQQVVSYERFSRKNLRDMGVSLWSWLFKLRELLETRSGDKLLSSMWRAGHVHGFISKQHAHGLLLALRDANWPHAASLSNALPNVNASSISPSPALFSSSSDGSVVSQCTPTGVALVRFSESVPGAVSLSALLPKGARLGDTQPKHIVPWSANTLKQPQTLKRRLAEVAIRTCDLRLVPSGCLLIQVLRERENQTIATSEPPPALSIASNHLSCVPLQGFSNGLLVNQTAIPRPPAELTYVSEEELVAMSSRAYEPTFPTSAPTLSSSFSGSMSMTSDSSAVPPNAFNKSWDFSSSLDPIGFDLLNGAAALGALNAGAMEWESDRSSISSVSSRSSVDEDREGFGASSSGRWAEFDRGSISSCEWSFSASDAISLDDCDIPPLPADLTFTPPMFLPAASGAAIGERGDVNQIYSTMTNL